ncbi:hypothetical protein CB1_000539010 [Camelus ferus]|nr:hypothetical protein CB1_000539010 [Camelus ferus]
MVIDTLLATHTVLLQRGQHEELSQAAIEKISHRYQNPWSASVLRPFKISSLEKAEVMMLRMTSPDCVHWKKPALATWPFSVGKQTSGEPVGPRGLSPNVPPPNSQPLACWYLKAVRSSRGPEATSSTSFLDECPAGQVVLCISSSWMSRDVEGRNPQASQIPGCGLRQPSPSVMDAQGCYSRGSIAWHMGDYEDTNQRNSRRATLVKQSKAALPRTSRPPTLPKLPQREEVGSLACLDLRRKRQAVST